MDLREEIQNKVRKKKTYPSSIDEVIDIAVEVFAKRIDIMIQECRGREKQYPIAVNYRIQPLLELKDMLK
jgi:hypothetical protein